MPIHFLPKLGFFVLLTGVLSLWGCTASQQSQPAPVVPAKPLTPEQALVAQVPIRGPADFGVVFTSGVQGSVKPCGCTQRPLGGVSRLATALKHLRAHYGDNLLFLDAGDLLFEKSKPRAAVEQCQDEARIELLLSTYKDLGVVQTVQGKRDTAAGLDKYKNWLETFQIHYAADAIVTTLQRVGKKEIGLLALRPEGEWTSLKPKVEQALHNLLQQQTDHIVVLSQLSLENLKSVSWPSTGVDVILQGHDPGEAPKQPVSLGAKGPWVLFNGIQGQHLGVVHFSWPNGKTDQPPQADLSFFNVAAEKKVLAIRLAGMEKRLKEATSDKQKTFLKKRISDTASKLHALEHQKADLPPEPAMRLFSFALVPEITPHEDVEMAVASYEQAIPDLVAQCEKDVICEPAEEGDAVYVGVQTCAACHDAAVKHWRKALHRRSPMDETPVGHSRAWLTLEELNKTRDRTCVGCHSVGFNEPGGYCKTDEVGFLADVQCESCHGAGSLHSVTGDPNFIDREVPENHCRGCHHVPHIESYESFKYEENLKIILGPGHGEKKWRQLMGDAALTHE